MAPAHSQRTIRLLLFAIFALLYLPLTAMFVRLCAHCLPGQPAALVDSALRGPYLHGMTTAAPSVKLSPRAWMNGEFQDSLTQWYSLNFGLRPYFICATNQIDYTVFHTSHMYSESLVVGKENTLYERDYLSDYCHIKPLHPLSEMQAQVAQFAELRKRLNRRGIAFVVLITPDKAAIEPEYMPPPYADLPAGGRRDYDNLVDCLRQSGVPYVDGHAITLAAKRNAAVPPFPRGGTHWNSLCAFDTTQSLVRAIEQAMGRRLPRLMVKAAPIVNKAWNDSNSDIMVLTNTLFPDTTYPVPETVFATEAGIQPLSRAVFVGGSFTKLPVRLLTDNRIIAQVDFYYYYHTWLQHAPDPTQRPIDTAGINWEQDVFNAPVIVLEINEALKDLGAETHFGAFTLDALKHLQP